MSLGIDTSVVVRLLIGQPAPLAAKAKERLLDAHRVRQLVIVSDLVIAEAYHALKYHYQIDSVVIRRALLDMLTSGLVQPEPGSAALAVLQLKLPGKAGFVDRLIQARYEVDGMTTLTFDKAQAKIGKTELVA